LTRQQRGFLRAATLIFAGWATLGLVQAMLAHALSAKPAAWGRLLGLEATLALLWTALTPAVVAWDRWLRGHGLRWASLVAGHVPALAGVLLLDSIARRWALQAFAGPLILAPFAVTVVYYADIVAVSYLAVIVVAQAFAARRALAARERVKARLEAQVARARLDFLEAQLQPHFLFNSLGAVSELAHESPAAGRRVLQQLASLLRFALTTETDEVPLGRELVGLAPYLDIQRLRFADWLNISFDVDREAMDCVVPRLVFQPLVENAIRHGLRSRSKSGHLWIRARVTNDHLVIRVCDDGAAIGPSALNDGRGRGIGLPNLRQRLSTLYGDDQELRLFVDDAEGTVAELRIPARRTPTRVEASTEESVAEGEPGFSVPREESGRPADANRHPLMTIVLAWILCGLLWIQQSIAYLALRDRLQEASLLQIAFGDLAAALLWALITPGIFAACRRAPIVGSRPVVRIAGYVITGALVAVAHAAAARLFMTDAPPFWSQATASLVVLDLLAFCVLVGLGHRSQLIAWLRDREVAEARLHEELAEVRMRAAGIGVDPRGLLAILEQMAECDATPVQTERALARLADYLRASLDASVDTKASRVRSRELGNLLALLRAEIDVMSPLRERSFA
jgi:two-component system LytT family sensor kinase